MIKKYKLKNGDTRYMFHSYIGVDPVTDKDVYRKRSGFKTKREAEIAEARLINDFNKNEIYQIHDCFMFRGDIDISELQNYIKDKINNYTYEKFIKDFPKSNLQNFELYKEKENALFEELLENYWNVLDKNFSNYSLINSKFTNQISDELNKINRIAVKEDKQEYYTNEVIKPFLDQAAKDFKEYIKDYIDTEE